MNTLLFILILAASIGLCIFLLGLWRQRNYERFQKNMKRGDFCYFYKDEDKMIGVVDDFVDDEIVVVGSELGMHLRVKSELYPITF